MNRIRLEQRLRRHESLSLKPYLDSEGRLTIGIGRCLDTRGIDLQEAEFMLARDIDRCLAECKSLIPGFASLSDLRQEVLVEMAFQMGMAGVLKFTRMIEALRVQDFERASAEMLDSKWAKQTTTRAQKLAGYMRDGQ